MLKALAAALLIGITVSAAACGGGQVSTPSTPSPSGQSQEGAATQEATAAVSQRESDGTERLPLASIGLTSLLPFVAASESDAPDQESLAECRESLGQIESFRLRFEMSRGYADAEEVIRQLQEARGEMLDLLAESGTPLAEAQERVDSVFEKDQEDLLQPQVVHAQAAFQLPDRAHITCSPVPPCGVEESIVIGETRWQKRNGVWELDKAAVSNEADFETALFSWEDFCGAVATLHALPDVDSWEEPVNGTMTTHYHLDPQAISQLAAAEYGEDVVDVFLWEEMDIWLVQGKYWPVKGHSQGTWEKLWQEAEIPARNTLQGECNFEISDINDPSIQINPPDTR